MRLEILSTISLIGGAAAISHRATTNTTEPCGLITAKALEFYKNESNQGLFYFDTALGNACLESSAIDNELAAAFVSEYKKYVEFQTTLSYLAAPPAGYPYAPVDILGGLDAIKSKAAAGGFKSQYAFDQALAQLLTSAHEGHLFTSLCTARAIGYFRSVDFVSLSSDGIQLPLVYTLDDADAYTDNFTVSNIVSINGENVTSFIENAALFQTSDPDAAYNAMFWGVAQAPLSGNCTGGLTELNVNQYPGPYTNLTFANGTQRSYPNQAAISPNIWSFNITDGKTFTYELCIGPAQAAEESSSASGSSPTSSSTAVPSQTSATPSTTSAMVPNPPTMLGHPETPIVKDSNNAVAGYFLNGTQYNDTAVLYVASFDNANFNDPLTYPFTFANTTRDFLAAAKAAGKTKLVIDLSGNGGGNTLLPNDLFQRLFPNIEPYGAARYRISVAANIIGQTLGNLTSEDVNPLPTDNKTLAVVKADIESMIGWNFRTSLTTDLKNLTGWAETFPPNVVNGDNFTINVRAPTNNTYFDTTTDSIVPAGSAGTPKLPQPFAAEDIVILTDGICASACSIFTEFMTRQAGVKTIAVGGRPRHAPMQAIGGTKGSAALLFSAFQIFSPLILELVPDSLLDLANKTLPGLVNLPLGEPSSIASYSLNLRDNIPVGDDSQTPLQFIFEPADCRMFYTHLTASIPHLLWESAADVAWRGSKCAIGGISGNGSTGTGSPPSEPTPTPFASDASAWKLPSAVVMGAILFSMALQAL